MNNSRPHPLATFIATPGKINALARKVRCSPAHLRNIRDGRKIPSLPLATRLSNITGLKTDAFLRPEDVG